jgi:hypothetical protein
VSRAIDDIQFRLHAFSELPALLLLCHFWASGSYFGSLPLVTATVTPPLYPSIEANEKVMRVLDELGWQRYLDVFTLLGIPEQPEPLPVG